MNLYKLRAFYKANTSERTATVSSESTTSILRSVADGHNYGHPHPYVWTWNKL